MIDYLRESPTWRGVLILFGVSILISICLTFVIADRATDKAIGNRIDRLEKLLDQFEKLTVSQTQNVNVGGDGEKLRDQRVRDILANRNELKE